MATFEAKVYRLKVETHPNADALELARVGDYVSCVRKGQFKTGQLGVYIPEQAILPEWLIKQLGLEGKLAGSAKNRVKAVKLRGVLSQGLIYPVLSGSIVDPDFIYADGSDGHIRLADGNTTEVALGEDVAEVLGLVKYEPPIPTSMSGEVQTAYGKTLKYDIENIKKYPSKLADGEIVVVTEKLHGTWCCIGYHPEVADPVVTSKGLSASGLCFKFNEANANNLYVIAYHAVGGDQFLQKVAQVLSTAFVFPQGTPFYILGEIFGRGVQDLHYGMMQPQFRAFDVFVGDPATGSYLGALDKERLFKEVGLEQVPVLYRGPFDKKILDELTSGTETVSGKSTNMREGVVITPMIERKDDEIGRVILKSVSEAYLLRKGDVTEFN